MDEVRRWLLVGRRFELVYVAVCVTIFLGGGLFLTAGEPKGTPGFWVGWVFAALMALTALAVVLTLAPRLRRSWAERDAADRRPATIPPLSARLGLYLLLLLLAVDVAIRLAGYALQHHMSTTWVVNFLVADLAVLAFVIANNEVRIRRKSRNSSAQR